MMDYTSFWWKWWVNVSSWTLPGISWCHDSVLLVKWYSSFVDRVVTVTWLCACCVEAHGNCFVALCHVLPCCLAWPRPIVSLFIFLLINSLLLLFVMIPCLFPIFNVFMFGLLSFAGSFVLVLSCLCISKISFFTSCSCSLFCPSW